MLVATPVFMEVRPFQVSHLCFEVGGILGQSFVELGTEVFAFNFRDFYAKLRQSGPFDSSFIDDNLNLDDQLVLASLRAETQRAALDRAISARSNAFITRYSPDASAAVIDVMRKVFRVKGNQINVLSSISNNMAQLLDDAYTAAKRTGAVTTTDTVSTNSATTDGNLKLTNDADPPGSHAEPGSTQSSSSTTNEKQNVTTTNVEFRVPMLENEARNQRAQISLGQEVISFVAESHYQDQLERVFANELAAIDADARRLGVAYLNTMLRSPIRGIVTGVYKNPGDPVSAGEPVFRVENDAVILIVASVVCRGLVPIGHILSITTKLFDGSGPLVPINAAIVSARGQGDDDQWEVIGKVSNLDAAGNKIFPLGYRFDIEKEITQISIKAPSEI